MPEGVTQLAQKKTKSYVIEIGAVKFITQTLILKKADIPIELRVRSDTVSNMLYTGKEYTVIVEAMKTNTDRRAKPKPIELVGILTDLTTLSEENLNHFLSFPDSWGQQDGLSKISLVLTREFKAPSSRLDGALGRSKPDRSLIKPWDVDDVFLETRVDYHEELELRARGFRGSRLVIRVSAIKSIAETSWLEKLKYAGRNFVGGISTVSSNVVGGISTASSDFVGGISTVSSNVVGGISSYLKGKNAIRLSSSLDLLSNDLGPDGYSDRERQSLGTKIESDGLDDNVNLDEDTFTGSDSDSEDFSGSSSGPEPDGFEIQFPQSDEGDVDSEPTGLDPELAEVQK